MFQQQSISKSYGNEEIIQMMNDKLPTKQDCFDFWVKHGKILIQYVTS
jgi:hypothetical protein